MALEDDELSRFLIMMGLGTMGAKNPWEGIARGGMFGIQGVDQLREQKNRKALTDAKLREEALQEEQKRLALERQKKLMEVMTGGAQPQPAGSQRSVVDAPGWTPQVPQQAPQDVAQMLLKAGFIKEAEDYAKARGAIHGEAYGNLQTAKNGQPYYMTKQGPRYAESGAPVPQEELHFGDTGDRTNVGFNKFTGAEVSPGVKKGLSPAEQQAQARWGAEFGRGTYDSERGGFVTPKGFTGVPGLPGGKGAREDMDKLRGEFNALPEVKNYKDVVPIYNAATKAPDTAAGDFALIYGVGKVLDPNSAIKEAEMKMVAESGSPAHRVAGYLAYLKGQGRLTPGQRAELTDMLHSAVGERKAMYDQARQGVARIAAQRGYAPDQVFMDAPVLGGGEKPQEDLAAAIRAEIERKRREMQQQGGRMTYGPH